MVFLVNVQVMKNNKIWIMIYYNIINFKLNLKFIKTLSGDASRRISQNKKIFKILMSRHQSPEIFRNFIC